jgi:hypothetical protein
MTIASPFQPIVANVSLPMLHTLATKFLVPAFIAAGLGARPATVYALGLWIVAVSLIAYELLAGLAIGLRRLALLGQTAIGAVLAVGIVALKALLG